MFAAEHARIARALLARSEREFADGNTLIGSELLWGAAGHAILGIATERGWHKNSHGAIKAAARMLSGELDNNQLLSDFDSAEKLHANFYHNNLNAREITRRREQAERLIPHLLAILG